MEVAKIDTKNIITYDDVCLVLKAMSHPQRLILMSFLIQGPKTVSELVSLCDCSQPQISHFVTRMKSEGLIKSKREGKNQYYSIADEKIIQLMKTIQTEYCKI